MQHFRVKPRSLTDDDCSTSSSSEDPSSTDSDSDEDDEFDRESDSYRVSLTGDVDLDIPRRGRVRSSGVYRASLAHKVRIYT